MKVIVINGFAGVGKSTFVKFCKEEAGKNQDVFELSTIDSIKKIAKSIGWNGQKTRRDRKFLSDLKDLLTQYNDYPHQIVLEKIFEIKEVTYKPENLVIFVHCREPEEIQRFKDELNATTLLLRRAKSESVMQVNHADNGVFDFKYDFDILNNNGLDELKKDAKIFMENLGE